MDPLTQRSVTRVFTCTPAVAYDRVSDVEATAVWSDEVQSISWDVRSDPVAVGDRFTAHNAIGTTTWTATSEVTAARPSEQFAFAVGGPVEPTATWTFDLEPVEDATRVTYSVVIGSGPSMLKAAAGTDAHKLARMTARRLDALAASMAGLLDALS